MLPLSHRNIAMPFGMEKLEWCGYPMVKNFKDIFIHFDKMYECDRHTYTSWWHRTRLHSIMWQKLIKKLLTYENNTKTTWRLPPVHSRHSALYNSTNCHEWINEHDVHNSNVLIRYNIFVKYLPDNKILWSYDLRRFGAYYALSVMSAGPEVLPRLGLQDKISL